MHTQMKRKSFKKEIENNPTNIKDCSFQDAQNGDVSQKMYLVKAYLSEKECNNADKYLKEIFDLEPYYNGIEGPAEYLGMLQHHNECLDLHSDLC